MSNEGNPVVTVIVAGVEYAQSPCPRCGGSGTSYDATMADKVASDGVAVSVCPRRCVQGKILTITQAGRQAEVDAWSRLKGVTT